MKRNFKNYIIWEEPGDDRLFLEAKKNLVNTEEIQAIFDTQINGTFLKEQEVVLKNAPVQISCEKDSTNIKIFLDVLGSLPLKIRRNGQEIASELFEADFPYVDENVENGEFLYEVESNRENVDTCTVIVND
jgi:Zn finger protein HypA/HybF involved in hydrogenase expression